MPTENLPNMEGGVCKTTYFWPNDELQDNSIVVEFGDVGFWIVVGYNLPIVIYIFVIFEKNTKTEIA